MKMGRYTAKHVGLYHETECAPNSRGKFIKLSLRACKELMPERKAKNFSEFSSEHRKELERRLKLYQVLGGRVNTAFGDWDGSPKIPPIDHLPDKQTIARMLAMIPKKK